MRDEIQTLCEEIEQLNLENTRLKAEVERLRAANLQLMNGIDTITLRLREEKEATIAWLRDRQKPTVKGKP